MDENGTLYASKFQKMGESHHSSLLGERPVAGAGEIGVKNGELVFLSDKSGHYMPGRDFTNQVLTLLRDAGVSIDSVELSCIVKIA